MLILQRPLTFRSAFTCNESFLFWIILLLVLLKSLLKICGLKFTIEQFYTEKKKKNERFHTSTEKYLQIHKSKHMPVLSCSGNRSVNHLVCCFWRSSLSSIMDQVHPTDMLQMTAWRAWTARTASRANGLESSCYSQGHALVMVRAIFWGLIPLGPTYTLQVSYKEMELNWMGTTRHPRHVLYIIAQMWSMTVLIK